MGKSYYEFTRRPSRQNLQNIKLQKESEFEKPYRKDEYPEMQHFAPSSEPPPWTLPGWETPGTLGVPGPEWVPGDSSPPFPPPGPPGDPGSPYPPGPPWWPDEDPPRPNLRCPPNMECSPRNSKQVAADGCGLVFVGGMCGRSIAARILAISDDGFKIRGSGNNFSCEHCQPSFFVNVCYDGSDPDARAYIEFVDTQFSDIRLAYIICIIKANCCAGATQISYSAGNPATIGQSSEAAITVDDGCPPFSWSVAGTGYSFAQTKTQSRSNTLITDGDACGTATITVTDDCGDTATGYVRGTTGEWIEKEEMYAYCPAGLFVSGQCTECAEDAGGCLDNAGPSETIIGNKKWYFSLGGCVGVDDGDNCDSGSIRYMKISGCAEPDNPPPCGNPLSCYDGGESCNPHYETCTGIGCVWELCTYYEWECAP